ncbi:hypothetical protein PHMEG_00011500 [Phytophthora megakarya]|uniref:Uncharacterized protein n=1 Tax=Phytophthora megakarya TaxID=4795 RepID=A0A225WDL3_9STRA|nr:hypothetical protein PHMEG_00011500 [Phytophthora megakarya]
MSLQITPPILSTDAFCLVSFFDCAPLCCLSCAQARQFKLSRLVNLMPEPRASAMRSTASNARRPSLLCSSTSVHAVSATCELACALSTADNTAFTRSRSMHPPNVSITNTVPSRRTSKRRRPSAARST